MAFLAYNSFLQQTNVGLDGLGINPWEKRIHLATHLNKRNSMLAEDASQHAPPGAVHYIHRKLEIGSGNTRQISKLRNRFDVGNLEIGLNDLRSLRCLGPRSRA